MTRRERVDNLKRDLPAIFLSMKDKDTPLRAKICAGLAIGYALSPIDLIPDFIPILGYLDDLIVLPALVALTIKWIPKDVLERNRNASKDLWKNGKPRKWYYAVPIVLLWLVLLWIVIKAVFL